MDTPEGEESELHWGLASVEVSDSDNDVISIDGISFELPMPLKGDHEYTGVGGKATTVGSVKKAIKTTVIVEGKSIPALMVGIEFADTENGREYETLYVDGHQDGLSGGFMYLAAKPNDIGGLNVSKCKMVELSLCTWGANRFARFIKAQNQFNTEVKMISEMINITQKSQESIQKQVSQQDENHAELALLMDQCVEKLDAIVKHCENHSKTMKSICQRMDTIESELICSGDVEPKQNTKELVEKIDKFITNLK
jgi:hypothetical protein